jgi:4'-phosphopantetheinyl transferase
VQFNLSHSGCWGVIALRVGAAVGIDVEQVDAPRNIPQLVDFAFTAEEKLQWQAFLPARQRRGFYRLWTAREARLKCAGVGLTSPTLPPAPALLRWFPVSRNYLAAVVSAAPVVALSRFHLDLAALG